MKWISNIVKKAKRTDSRWIEFDGKMMDIITFTGKNWPRMGLIMGQEALIVDYKTLMAFRVKSGNMGFSKDVRIMKVIAPLNKEFLNQYFCQNHDNPYGVVHILTLIHRGIDVNGATQYPPLYLPQLTGEARRLAVKRLVESAREGDFIFSSNRIDPMSAAIRKYDRCQFSHVAPYLGDGQVGDVGPGGSRITSLFDKGDNTHLALYTIVDLPEESRKKMVQFTRARFDKGFPFGYRDCFLTFLRKRFNIRIGKSIPSVDDLLSANKFRLVSYL